MEIKLETTTINATVISPVEIKIDAKELADIITKSGFMEAASAAGVDPVAAVEAMLGTPDAFEAMLSGDGQGAFDTLTAGLERGIEDLGFGSELPTGETGFGDGTGFPGQDGHDYQDDGSEGGTSGGVIDLFAEERAQEEADATDKGEDAATSVFDTARDMSGGIEIHHGSGEIIELWPDETDDAGTDGTTGTDPNEPQDDTNPGDAGKPDDGDPPEESGDDPVEPQNNDDDDEDEEKEAPETGNDETSATGSGTDGTTQPGSGEDEGGIVDGFDFKDDLGNTTQPGLLGDDGGVIVVTVNEPGYGLTQPALDAETGGGVIDAETLDPSYGLTQPVTDDFMF